MKQVDIKFNTLNVDSFLNSTLKINSSMAKVCGIPLTENIVTITSDVISEFIKDNPSMLSIENGHVANIQDKRVMEDLLSENAIEYFKENIITIIKNASLKENLKDIYSELISNILEYSKIDKRSTNLLHAYSDIDSGKIEDAVKESSDTEISLELEPLSDKLISSVYQEGKGDDKKLMLSQSSITYKTIDENDYANTLTHSIVPEKIRITLGASTKATFEILKLDDSCKPDLLTIQSENLSKSYFYGKDIVKDFHNICIDEADKGVSGKGVNIYYAIARNSDNVVVGTGTATEGYASGIVSMLAYSGNFKPKDITSNIEEFKTLCDKWQIKNPFIMEVVSASATNNEIGVEFVNQISTYIQSKKNKNGFNPSSFAKENATHLLKIIAENFEHKMDALAKFDINQVSKAVSGIYEAAYKMSTSKSSSLDLTESPQSIIMRILFENRNFLKRYPGIANIGTYATQIGSFDDSVNVSIGTRSTILKRKETMLMHDLNDYVDMASNTDIKRGLEASELVENNNIGVMVASRALSDYSNVQMIPQVKGFLSRNFDNFLDSFTSKEMGSTILSNNIDIILSSLNDKTSIDVSHKDVINAISKSTSQSPDDAATMYRHALSSDFSMDYFNEALKLNNGNLTEESKSIRHQKLDIFKALIQTYSEICLNKEFLISAEDNESKNGLIAKSKYGGYSLGEIFTPVFTQIADKKLITIRASELEYSETGIPVGAEFSKKLNFFKHDRWSSFSNTPIEHLYKYGNEREEEIFDTFGAKGLENSIDNEINKGRNPIIASSRIAGMIISAYDTVQAGILRENKEKPLVIIVNVSDSYAREMIKNIDDEVLKDNKIEIVPVTRTMLDSTIRFYAKKDVQMSVNSNYESISRGLDLSMQDCIIAGGAFTNGRELIQFLSRLYSVTKTSAEVHMFSGGKSAGFMLTDKIDHLSNSVQDLLDASPEYEEELIGQFYEDMIITTSYSNKLNERGYEKMITNERFMSGEMSDVARVSRSLVELSKSYDNMINSDNEKTNENNILR